MGGSLFAEFVDAEDDSFMGTISLKDLVFIPLLNALKILLHIYDRNFVHGRCMDVLTQAGSFYPLNSDDNGLAHFIGEMFILLHLSTLSGCL